MPMQQQDVIVLGAGIVGVSTALHLQARGRSVLLIDKGEPGEGTSYGNAGLVERSSVIPYSFPQGLWNLLRYGMNRRSDVRYDPLYLPRIARWLFQYWRESSPERLKIATQAMLPLVEAGVREHDFLVQQAGCAKADPCTGLDRGFPPRARFQCCGAPSARFAAVQSFL